MRPAPRACETARSISQQTNLGQLNPQALGSLFRLLRATRRPDAGPVAPDDRAERARVRPQGYGGPW